MCSLPAGSHHLLEQQVDYDHEGVDKDLDEIAQYMLDWEEKLLPHLSLTEVDRHDIKVIHSNSPVLQR